MQQRSVWKSTDFGMTQTRTLEYKNNFGMPNIPDEHNWLVCNGCNCLTHMHFDQLAVCRCCGGVDYRPISEFHVRVFYFYKSMNKKLMV